MSILGKLAKEGLELAVKKTAKTEAKEGTELAVKKGAPAIVKKVSGAAKRATDNVKYDRAKIASQYPDAAPLVMQVDKKSGKAFPGKGSSPEADALAKARQKARKSMDSEGYAPFFAVDRRFHVDPARHPVSGRSIEDAVPVKEAKRAEYRDKINSPELTSNLSRAYEAAKDDPLARDWYAMGQLEDAFRQQYGPEQGARMYQNMFADPMAATTGGADPTSNLLMAAYGNFQKGRGLRAAEESYDLPYPVGGRFVGGNMKQFNRFLIDDEPLEVKLNPKRFNFSSNFMGHLDRATIDEQLSRLYPDLVAAGKGNPPKVAYGLYEEPLHALAKQYGVSPALLQEVAWAGAKGTKGKPMISHVNDAIERTSRVTGLDPEQVLYEAILAGDRPVYAKGGRVDALAVKRRAGRR